MMSKLLFGCLAALMLAGCSDSSTSALGVQTATLQPPPAAGVEPPRNTQPTFASKVLSAIALERVTGRKADPGRLAEAN